MASGTGRVALVTGASGGIGEAAARALLGAGFTVYGTSRRAAAGETRGGVVFLPLDVTDDVSGAGAVREGLERRGSPAAAPPRGGGRAAGTAPAVIAKVIVAAATDSKPKLRYPAGSGAGRVSTLRRLVPARIFDKQIRKTNQLAAS